jgi:hypothetical protein
MTFEIGLTLAIILGALIVFGTEKLRVDVVALLVLITVGLTGLVGPFDPKGQPIVPFWTNRNF